MYYSIKRPRPLRLPGLQLVLIKLINLYSELMTKTTDLLIVVLRSGSAFGVSLSIAPSIRRECMGYLPTVSSSYVSVFAVFSLLTNNGQRPKFIVGCSLAPFSMFLKSPPPSLPTFHIYNAPPPPLPLPIELPYPYLTPQQLRYNQNLSYKKKLIFKHETLCLSRDRNIPVWFGNGIRFQCICTCCSTFIVIFNLYVVWH